MKKMQGYEVRNTLKNIEPNKYLTLINIIRLRFNCIKDTH